MKIHAPLLPLAFCFIVGIVIGSSEGVWAWLKEWTIMLPLLMLAALATLTTRHFSRLQQGLIACSVVICGILLASRTNRQLTVKWSSDECVWQAVVVSEPLVKKRSMAFDVLTLDGQQKIRCRIVNDARSQRIKLGDGLQFHSRIQPIRHWQQGHFDYQRYMCCQGFVGESFVRPSEWQVKQLSLTGLSAIQRLRLLFLMWRHQLLERYYDWGISDEAYGVVAAMTLGERSDIDSSLRETYSLAGTSHVLALSGLHLMMIYSIMTLLFGWHRFRMLSQVLIVLSIWAFAFLVGLSPSVVRAAFMISIYALLSLGYRERMSVNTLAFAAIVMLVINPMTIYDIGFQLSFTAVLAILLIYPILDPLIPFHVQQRHHWLKWLWGLMTVSLSAQAGTAPLVIYYFGRFPTWFLLGNFIVVPLATIILYLSLLMIVTSWWPALQAVVVTILSSVVVTMNGLIQYIVALPANSIEVTHFSALQVILLYILISSVCVLISIAVQEFRRNG